MARVEDDGGMMRGCQGFLMVSRMRCHDGVWVPPGVKGQHMMTALLTF